MTSFLGDLGYPPTEQELEDFFEKLRLDAFLRHETQKIRYAATVTPDAFKGENVIVDTLTGGITVNNPINAHEGLWLRFKFVQDGAGGHAVAWGTDFKVNWTPVTTANKINTISFRYDGSDWIQMSSAVGM